MPCNGAAVAIVTSAERARSLPNPPVYILGAGGGATSHEMIWQESDITVTPVVISAPRAFQMAGYGPKDMQFAEFYDCYTILEAVCLEDAGFCKKGEIGDFFDSTDTTYKGSFPINTDVGQTISFFASATMIVIRPNMPGRNRPSGFSIDTAT